MQLLQVAIDVVLAAGSLLNAWGVLHLSHQVADLENHANDR